MEEKIEGTILFIRHTPERELAEFIVLQSEAIEGLSRNNNSYIKAFRELYQNKP